MHDPGVGFDEARIGVPSGNVTSKPLHPDGALASRKRSGVDAVSADGGVAQRQLCSQAVKVEYLMPSRRAKATWVSPLA